MKNLLSLALVLLFCGAVAQTQVNLSIIRITPDTVCPGDSIKVNYKGIWPTNAANQYTNVIYLNPGTVVLKSAPWQQLKARPKEHFTPLLPGDSAQWIKVKLPVNLSIGNYTVSSNTANTSTLYVKNCSCTVTANFNYSVSNMAVTFTSTSVGTNSTTVYNWDFGVNTGYQAFPASTSYTYFLPGTYSVSLLVTNPTCSNSITKTLTVSQPTVDTGINELSHDKNKPVYFDLYGRPTEPKAGLILIEQVGNVRRKVVLSSI